MIRKKFVTFFLGLFLVINTNVKSLENKILVKIEDQIITSLDINNEYDYLLSLNPYLKSSKKEDIIKLSKKSIIQEKIKKIEIEKNFNNPKIPQEILEQILQSVYSRIGFKNLSDFKEYLIISNIDFENVKNKIEIEALWNELILIKFSSKIKINEEKLKKRIEKENNQFVRSYLMSEIFFEVLNLKDLNNKFIEISNTIKNKGFDFAALKYSISSTSSFGGKLDWINESSLNKNIKKSIKDLGINDFTRPIVVPGGFLILQIKEIKSTKLKIDINKELKEMINFEKNNQLNQYSKIYFNKIKKNLDINEF